MRSEGIERALYMLKEEIEAETCCDMGGICKGKCSTCYVGSMEDALEDIVDAFMRLVDGAVKDDAEQ